MLLLNRCHARLSSQHYDAALEDAKAVLDLDLKNEKGLFRAARALYGLRRFKDCRDYLQNLLAIYPKNQAALTDVARCECRFQEEAGHFDFAAMLDEAVAKSPRPHMDRADWVGPIEIRKCAIESHGRGLFTTKAVKAGDLLLVEKAFSTAFDTGNDEIANTTAPLKDINSEKSVAVLKLRAELATGTFVKLHRNPSVVPRFAALYPGPDAVEDIDEATNLPELDEYGMAGWVTRA